MKDINPNMWNTNSLDQALNSTITVMRRAPPGWFYDMQKYLMGYLIRKSEFFLLCLWNNHSDSIIILMMIMIIMINPESVLQNETHKSGILRCKGSPNLGQTTRPSNNQQQKKNLPNCRLCCPDWPQNKIERKRKERLGMLGKWQWCQL